VGKTGARWGASAETSRTGAGVKTPRRDLVSLVEQAVANLSEGHSLGSVDIPKRRAGTSCRLESGIETAFVAVFCNYIWQSLAANGDGPPFHEFFYIPSTRAEKKVGYDLSIGDFGSDRRIRTMHKLVYRRWCDQKWQWSVSAAFDRDHRPYRTYGHMRTLFQACDALHAVEPYLVLHVCHCIHDYRRMGTGFEGYRIPSFDNLLRTVIVSLCAVPEQIPGWENTIRSPDFRLTVRKHAPAQLGAEPSREFLARVAAKDQFETTVEPGNLTLSDCILTLDEFCDRIRRMFEPQQFESEQEEL
jgi:hypothetical protein